MNSSLIRFVIIIAFLGLAQDVSTVRGTPQKNCRMGLFPHSEKCKQQEVRPTGRRFFGAGPAPAWLQAPAAAKPQPLTKEQLLELVGAKLTNQRISELLRDRGLDFPVDNDYMLALRRAGANEQLITMVRAAGKKIAPVAIGTEPNAQVFLDGNLQGQADARGELSFEAPFGAHTLKVSLAGKQDFEQSITIAEGQPTRVVAPLVNLAGSVRVKAPAGASVWLDDSIRGTIDSSGELLINQISPGTHSLRVAARGKVDGSLSVVVVPGAETPAQVSLTDGVRVNPQDGLKYVWIAPGNFMMGCSPGDNECASPEKPAHQVTLRKAYWVGQTEVTIGAYKHFVDATKRKMPPVAPKLYKHWTDVDSPIVDANWEEAGQYCTWVGGRLPTEAEWEFAARGGSPLARYGSLSTTAWNKENADNRTHDVAAKLANGYGLFDTLGNVWEWVNDWFDTSFYQSGAALDPTGPATGQEKVLRGGSWIDDPKLLRASDRYSVRPDARSDFFGFRCVWEPKAP